ncbi:MAG TPA: hypothetical protein VM933_09090 [Acidimicrobiales bacterium]|nr:hypothetical protein [Acidimicrobiales bacterium]
MSDTRGSIAAACHAGQCGVVAHRPRQPRAIAPPPDETGPFAAVWRRIRRLPIDVRNDLPRVEAEPEGADDEVGAVAITCGGGQHEAVVATDGLDLALLDHDVDAELAMLALGGPLPACLVYAAVWHHALSDPAYLLAWGDDLEDEGLRTAREDWEGNYWESWPADPPAARVLFGRRLQRALALAAARRAASAARAGGFDGWHALQRATSTRARRAFVRSLAPVEAHPRPDALVPVRIRMDLSAHGGAVQGRLARLGSAVDLVLPVDWLWTVWPLDDQRNGFVLSRRDGRMAVVRWRRSGGLDGEHVPEVVRVPDDGA